MSIQTIEAVYEHGIFRLMEPPQVPIEEGQRVRLVVETEPVNDDVLALATSIFDGLSEQDIAEIDTIAGQREPFFGERS
jgi:predicted DNA-binding antitoxin AbrB/MazE fold protein